MVEGFIKGEGKNVEFKRELPKKSEKYIKSVVAFANTTGGKIIIGIDDETHEVIGVEESAVFDIMDAIANTVSDMCIPQIVPDISFKTVEHKCIVIIEIYPSLNRPYYINSLGKEEGTYIRVAGTTRKADLTKIKELEMQGANLSYDEMVCIDYKVTDEAVAKLCNDIKQCILAYADAPETKKTVKDVTVTNLENWGVLKRVEGKVLATNAFVLLTSDHFRFAKIQCARFKGTERVVFIDKREFSGALYEQIEEAYQFVLKHINLGAEISGLVRKDVYELPVGSIRESIVNAVTHRNYMETSCVQVAVYDDRVEVTSPGMLYGDLDIESIKQGKSKIRNTGIAEIFNRMKIIEEWGTGISRIISGCREYGLSEPEFIELGDSFRVNIFRKQESSQESSQENLTKTQAAILNLIRENPNITQQEMAEKIGVSFAAIKKNIALLKDSEIISRLGSTKKGSWLIR
ncbi:MAG: putative DNA binding domain-containing protein [Pelosinus sp.]|nr:putative DNA binding domain-containing protein [Pelosinus sp.]